MKTLSSGLAARYLASLRAHLSPDGPAKDEVAQRLGRSASAAGLTALDLAEIHLQARLTLESSDVSADLARSPTRSLNRAAAFFAQALIPLEAARREVRADHLHLRERHETLRRHAAALAKGVRQLEREVARRKAGEAKIVQAGERYRVLFAESQAMQTKLRQLTRQVISTHEDERKKISRKLHDEVVQTLVGINVELSAHGRSAVGGAQNLKRKITRAQRLVERSVTAVHRFARELRPAVLDDLGLIPALHAYSKNLAARRKIRIKLTAFAGVEALPIARRTVLFRVAQEALDNVVRHAEATEARLTLGQIPTGIRMEISDNGKSFAVKQTLLAKNKKWLGLLAMRERIAMIGGSLTIESAPGQGTTVRIEIPSPARKK